MTHRGKHPEDDRLFGPESLEKLRRAVEDLSLLLSKGYGEISSLKLVGDHFCLTARQRIIVSRCSCSDTQLARRRQTLQPIESAAGQTLVLDGYNILIILESALSKAYLFGGRDSCIRDLASVHGTWRKVTETRPAIDLILKVLMELHIQKALWLLDSPVSNSGRLKTILRELSKDTPFETQIELMPNPDAYLKSSDCLIASSDSAVLDECRRWVNLTAHIVNWLRHTGHSIELIDMS